MYLALMFGLIEIAAAGQLCMNCTELTNPQECNIVIRCGDHQQCYMEKYVRHNAILFDLGCINNTVCDSVSGVESKRPISIIGKRGIIIEKELNGFDGFDFDVEDDRRFPVCESCCNSTICNNGGACGIADFDYRGGRLCFDCDTQSSLDICDRFTWCEQDKHCFTYKKPPTPGHPREYQTGCSDDKQICMQSTEMFWIKCCYTNLCNNHNNSDQYSSIHTTTIATTQPAASQGIPSIINITVRPVNYQFGDNVQLICSVASNPTYISLGWNIEAEQNHIPSNTHIGAKYHENEVVLNIQHLTRENIRRYQCFVQNAFGQDTQTYSLISPQ